MRSLKKLNYKEYVNTFDTKDEVTMATSSQICKYFLKSVDTAPYKLLSVQECNTISELQDLVYTHFDMGDFSPTYVRKALGFVDKKIALVKAIATRCRGKSIPLNQVPIHSMNMTYKNFQDAVRSIYLTDDDLLLQVSEDEKPGTLFVLTAILAYEFKPIVNVVYVEDAVNHFRIASSNLNSVEDLIQIIWARSSMALLDDYLTSIPGVRDNANVYASNFLNPPMIEKYFNDLALNKVFQLPRTRSSAVNATNNTLALCCMKMAPGNSDTDERYEGLINSNYISALCEILQIQEVVLTPKYAELASRLDEEIPVLTEHVSKVYHEIMSSGKFELYPIEKIAHFFSLYAVRNNERQLKGMHIHLRKEAESLISTATILARTGMDNVDFSGSSFDIFSHDNRDLNDTINDLANPLRKFVQAETVDSVVQNLILTNRNSFGTDVGPAFPNFNLNEDLWDLYADADPTNLTSICNQTYHVTANFDLDASMSWFNRFKMKDLLNISLNKGRYLVSTFSSLDQSNELIDRLSRSEADKLSGLSSVSIPLERRAILLGHTDLIFAADSRGGKLDPIVFKNIEYYGPSYATRDPLFSIFTTHFNEGQISILGKEHLSFESVIPQKKWPVDVRPYIFRNTDYSKISRGLASSPTRGEIKYSDYRVDCVMSIQHYASTLIGSENSILVNSAFEDLAAENLHYLLSLLSRFKNGNLVDLNASLLVNGDIKSLGKSSVALSMHMLTEQMLEGMIKSSEIIKRMTSQFGHRVYRDLVKSRQLENHRRSIMNEDLDLKTWPVGSIIRIIYNDLGINLLKHYTNLIAPKANEYVGNIIDSYLANSLLPYDQINLFQVTEIDGLAIEDNITFSNKNNDIFSRK